MESFDRCCFAAYPHLSAFIFFLAGILQHPDGTVLKQLQPPPRGPRELQFYNMVTSLDFVFHYIFFGVMRRRMELGEVRVVAAHCKALCEPWGFGTLLTGTSAVL